MGRKKLKPTKRRRNCISIYVTDEEFRFINQYAVESRVTKSQAFRLMILDRMVEKFYPELRSDTKV